MALRKPPLSVGIVVFVLAVTVGVPIGAASSVTMTSPSRTLNAPYHGYQYNAIRTYQSGCGTTAKALTAPHLNLTSGIGQMAAKTSARACGGPSTAYNIGGIYLQLGFYSKVLNLTHTYTSETFHWVVSYSGVLKSKPGSPKEMAHAQDYVYAESGIYTPWNGSRACAGYWFQGNSTDNGTITFANAVTITQTCSVTLPAGLPFYLVSQVYLDTYAQVQATGTSVASTAVNLSGTHSAQLTSIVLS